jgi:hypothetical protein
VAAVKTGVDVTVSYAVGSVFATSGEVVGRLLGALVGGTMRPGFLRPAERLSEVRSAAGSATRSVVTHQYPVRSLVNVARSRDARRPVKGGASLADSAARHLGDGRRRLAGHIHGQATWRPAAPRFGAARAPCQQGLLMARQTPAGVGSPATSGKRGEAHGRR